MSNSTLYTEEPFEDTNSNPNVFSPNVAKKILQVMQKVQYLKKDGKVDAEKFGIKYNYLSEAKITDNIRTACINAGLIIFPIFCETLPTPDTFQKVKVGYRLIDVDSGDSYYCEMLGLGQDKGDKSIYKALTGAYKYMQRQVFAIPTGDDPDKVCSEETIEEINKAAQPINPPIESETKILQTKVLAYVNDHNIDKALVKQLITDSFNKPNGLKSLDSDELTQLLNLLPGLL